MSGWQNVQLNQHVPKQDQVFYRTPRTTEKTLTHQYVKGGIL